jgi:hypothetical protein
MVSADGLFGKEAKIVLKRLALMLTEKWGKPYSEVCGYVNARMSIAIVRATHLFVDRAFQQVRRASVFHNGKTKRDSVSFFDNSLENCLHYSFYLTMSPHIFNITRKLPQTNLSFTREPATGLATLSSTSVVYNH